MSSQSEKPRPTQISRRAVARAPRPLFRLLVAIGVCFCLTPISAVLVAQMNTRIQVQQSPNSAPAITLAPHSAPLINATPHNGENRDVSLCVAGCFELAVSHAIPAYVSQDVPRAVSLAWSLRNIQPKGVIQLDVTDTSSTPATTVGLKLRDSSGVLITFDNGHTEMVFQRLSGTMRLAGSFTVTSRGQTRSHYYTAIVTSRWAGDSIADSVKVRVLNADFGTSPYGRGWRILGQQQLWKVNLSTFDSVVVSDGTGTLQYFARAACTSAGCTYASPKGDFSALFFDSTSTDTTNVYRRTYVDGTIVHFDPHGRQTKVEDRFGNLTRTWWRDSVRVDSVVDPVGKKTRLHYDATSHLDSIIDPVGRVSRFTVDTAGNLTTIYDPDGRVAFSGTYATASRALTRLVDRAGGTHGLALDYAHTLAADTLPTIAVAGTAQRPVIVYRSEERAVLVDTANATLGTIANPATPVLSDSVRAIVTDPRGNATRYALDRFNAPKRVEEPLHRTTVIARDTSARAVSTVTPRGHAIGFAYTGVDLTSVVDSTLSRQLTYAYDSRYHLLTQASGHAAPLTNTLTSDGKSDSLSRIASDSATRYTSRSDGRVAQVTDPSNHVTRYASPFSGFQNTDTIVNGNGGIIKTVRDAVGRDSVVFDPLGNKSTTIYDVLNRVIRAVGPRGDATRFAYDTSKNNGAYLTSVTDTLGNVTQFARNVLGWPDSTTDPNGQRTRVQYDSSGNVLHVTNRRGQTIDFTYDKLDNLLTRVSDGATTTFRTDSLDHFVVGSNAESTDTLYFDSADRPYLAVTIRGAHRSLVQSIFNDTLDVRTSVITSVPAASFADTTAWVYDARRVVTMIAGVGAGSYTYYTYVTVNQDHSQLLIQYPSALTETRNSVATHQDYQQTYGPTVYFAKADSILSTWYQVDNAGRVNARYSPHRDTVRRFVFDSASQLRTANDSAYAGPSCSGSVTGGETCSRGSASLVFPYSYSWDLTGNPSGAGLTVSAGNRLTYHFGDTLKYDLDGNLTQQGAFVHYNWNSLSQLTSLTNPSTASFGYDAWGRHVRVTVGTSSTGFLYDGVQALVEVDTAGNPMAEYSFYPDLDHPHSVRLGGASGTKYAVATDGLGNVTGLISDADSVPNWYRYDPFGSIIDYQALAGATTRLGFQAMPFDVVSGLSYARARYYDPVLGRFISEDPLGLAGGINPYVFAGNDPVNESDPLGLATCVGSHPCGDPILPPDCITCLADPLGGIGNYGDAGQGSGGGGGQPGSKPQTTSSKKTNTCSGSARVLKGNASTIGKPGGFSGPTAGNILVTAIGAAVIPSQWGGKGALRPYISQISGVFPGPNISFQGVVETIGSTAVPNVQGYLMGRFPGNLILELPGASRDYGITSVNLTIPASMTCPAGTTKVP